MSGQKLFENYIAGENLTADELVYLSANGTVMKAKADSSSTMPSIGMALEDKTSGQSVSVHITGSYENLINNTFSSFGKDLYVSDSVAGAITETAPTSPSITQRIGESTDTDGLLFGTSVGSGGETGLVGSTGLKGATGIQGLIGFTGAQGFTGATQTLYDAIVDASGGGDYTTASAAFNAGASSVYVRSGLYNEFQDIVVPDGGILKGEGGALLNFIGSFGITVDGSGGVKETAGTVSISTGGTTVTGSGTTFTNLSAGEYIRLGSSYFEIGSITNDTALEITRIWRGKSLSGETYIAQAMFTGCLVENFIILGSGGVGIHIRGVIGVRLDTIVVLGCTNDGILIEDSYGGTLIQATSKHNGSGTDSGIKIDNSVELSISGACHFDNNNGNGIELTNSSSTINITNVSVTSNTVYDITVQSSCNSCSITTGVIENNKDNGIITASSTSNTILQSSVIRNNGGWGVKWKGVDNELSGCIIKKNGLGSGGGINGGSGSTITGNQITTNTGHGLLFEATDNNNIITGNYIDQNTQDGVNISGDNNHISNNIIEQSTNNGITINVGSNDTHLSNNHIFNNTSANFVDNGENTYSNDYPRFEFSADSVDTPLTSDWAVNAAFFSVFPTRLLLCPLSFLQEQKQEQLLI